MNELLNADKWINQNQFYLNKLKHSYGGNRWEKLVLEIQKSDKLTYYKNDDIKEVEKGINIFKLIYFI